MKQNKLDVRNEKKGNIFGMPVTSVSNLFVAYVNNLMHGREVSNEDIKKLNTKEENLFHKVKQVCKVGGGYHDSQGLETLKIRLKLIEDEIRSGNTNQHLLVEVKDILTVMARQNVITKQEKDRFYKQLCNIND